MYTTTVDVLKDVVQRLTAGYKDSGITFVAIRRTSLGFEALTLTPAFLL